MSISVVLALNVLRLEAQSGNDGISSKHAAPEAEMLSPCITVLKHLMTSWLRTQTRMPPGKDTAVAVATGD